MKISKEEQLRQQRESRREWFLKNAIPVKKEQRHKDKTKYDRRKNKKIEWD
jgi:hypothetical protein